MKTIAEVKKLVDRSLGLRLEMREFASNQGALTPEVLTGRAKRLLEFFAPVLDTVDWTGGTAYMAAPYRKQFEHTNKVAAAQAMAVRLQMGSAALAKEASTAGVDLPTFTRQLLMTITRAYAQLFTLQLFGVIPLTGPTGRVHFKDHQYDSSYTGSTPFINPGDRTDDLTKLNPNYYLAPEGVQANKLKLHWSKCDYGVADYRVVAEWTDQFADDSAAVYDDDADSSNMNHMSQEMMRVVDRNMVTALINGVPSANQYTWTAAPTSNPNYATLSPSEQSAWDERLYKDGINTVISKIRTTRKYNNDGDPTWAIVGTNFALRLNKLSFFKPVNTSLREMDLQVGALRDLGEMQSLGIRFLVDPSLASSVSGGADMAFFGRKPVNRGDVGLYWLPYVALQPTRDLYDPDTGTTTKAVRSRFAIAQPNTAVEPATSQLGEVYGQLTVQ